MKFIDEYRDPESALRFANEIKKITSGKWNLMEICGGQTHSILRFGIDKVIPNGINLIHGPGCPVCVTPIEVIDKSIDIALTENVIFISFGDMLRVPGSKGSLLTAKSKGADVRIVYSPLDALKIAKENPGKDVVFFAIGFETTAPGNAMTIYQAREQQLNNFSTIISHMLVPPALEAVLSSPNVKIQGFLAAGHVCTVMGYEEYEQIAINHKIPIVVTGFEPLDILQGIYMCIKQLEEGRFEVENQYSRSVRREGNVHAKRIINEVFKVSPVTWRGIGEIPSSGLKLKDEFKSFDAEERFGHVTYSKDRESKCISGLILTGEKKPPDCPAFGKECKPEHPLGATMVSSEGTCAAYYRYRPDASK